MMYSEWMAVRIGKFTSCDITKLREGGTRPMTEEELNKRAKDDKRKTVDLLFGKGAMTYIKSKVAETLTQEPISEFNSNATDYGNANEADAVPAYQSRYPDRVVEYYGGTNPQFIPYGDFAGISLEAYVDQDGLMEIKCPYNSTNHISLLLINTPQELQNFKPEWYDQIQMAMLVTGRKWCDLVSYNPRILIKALQLKVIRIERDEEVIEDLKMRIAEGSKILNSMIRELSDSVSVHEPLIQTL